MWVEDCYEYFFLLISIGGEKFLKFMIMLIWIKLEMVFFFYNVWVVECLWECFRCES